ncbi:MAG: polysaccharide deacetylase [Sphingomonas sp.]|nr:polysaccharide deacetylase [Sphingomonas sp.]
MPRPVFLTVDTEIAWRHHRAGLDSASVYGRSLEPAGVGVTYQLNRLREHGLVATFFVDPMPALVYGLDPIKRVVGTILDAGQDVQLHLHPNWTAARLDDRRVAAPGNLTDYDRAAQQALIAQARDLLIAAGAPPPVAFRAGSYAANPDTLDALTALGFAIDSSHNGAMQPDLSMVDLPATQISPTRHRGLTEMPVSLIEDRPGRLRTVQICALSASEMRAALGHARLERHAAVVIVSHSFELANRAGTAPNMVHVRRFDVLCALLAEHRAMLPTHMLGAAPPVPLDQHDAPLTPNTGRYYWRQAEQLWSNLVAERAA